MVLSSSRAPMINGYRIIEQIYSSEQTLIYRGIREKDQKPVVIKLMRKENPTPKEISQFRNQYFIGKNLNSSSIVKSYSLENYDRSYAFVMEDFGGISLRHEIENSNLGKTLHYNDFIHNFLDIALQIASGIDELHRHQIIHKDIKPDNILINPETREVKIIDFSISTILPREVQFLINPDVLEGTLAYISPEQTGRMNRGIDYRTDYYSLGVTLFELLTGQVPFKNKNALELIYSHISKQPPVEKIIDLKVPLVISELICKLMAKNAEDRYQSGFGLKHDLKLCSDIFRNNQKIEYFELASKDLSDHFSMPDRLYGRKAEVQKLLDAFDRVINPPQYHLVKEKEARKGVELILVTGYSGTGKTATVNEIHKPILKEKGYFIKGKFSQLQNSIPFLGWVEALSDLIEQILSESDTQIEEWKASIISALDEQAQIMIDLIPKLELIIGAQPKPAELPGIEAQNRFGLLFQKFISIFAIRKHPLVIFLDDLQWADAASLNLIELLVAEKNIATKPDAVRSIADIQMPNFTAPQRNEEDDALLLIGSYRNNEIDAKHSLNLTIEEIKKTNIKINSIHLEPLNQSDLGYLISDTLKCEVNQIYSFTDVVFAKTKGNPFFIQQFIKTLYKDGIIKFNYEVGNWECDVEDVRKYALTDDVVEFMTLQIKRLPKCNQELLKIAACIGSQFDIETISKMTNQSDEVTTSFLWDSVLQGLVLPVQIKSTLSDENESQIELITDTGEKPEKCLGHINSRYFKFIHDRLQQAAYSQIPEAEKHRIHLKLGKQLLEKTAADTWDKDVFEITNQFNKALKLVVIPQERYDLAKMNLFAGQKALSATAYEAAFNYLAIGKELLDLDCWKVEYDLSLGLHETLAEAAFLTGDFTTSEESVEEVLAQAKTLLEKIKVYEIRIQVNGAQGKAVEAVNTALDVLKQLGIEFPSVPTQSDVEKAMAETASNLAGKEIMELADLPEMTEAEPLAAMRILSNSAVFAYQAVPDKFMLIILRMVNLSIEYGNTKLSAFAYVAYGVILCGIFREIEVGYKFGCLGKHIVKKLECKVVAIKVLETFNELIKPWKQHIKDTLNELPKIYYSAVQLGELEFSGYALSAFSFHSYFMGKELNELAEKLKDYSNAINQIKQTRIAYLIEIYRQTILNLQGDVTDICNLVGEAYNENKMLSIHIEANDGMALIYIYICKLNLCYLTSEYKQALKNATEGEKYLHGGIGTLTIPQYYFYDSLTRLALYAEAPETEQQEFLNKVAANQERMELWAHHAPMNFLHKFHLVEAEKCNVLDNNMKAIELFDLAIAGAKENEYIHEEALANELAAKFYLKWGKQKIAKAYLNDAYYGYLRWGAKAKVKDLQKRYPQLLRHILIHEETNLTSDETNSASQATPLSDINNYKTISDSKKSISTSLDLESVIQASQALSEQIELEELLSTLMKVIMENAGASKCALILSKNANLDLEITAISCNYDSSSIHTKLSSIALESSKKVPIRLINYVKRTKETLVIDDANTEKFLAADTYILDDAPKSILCIPIINQGKFFGILYLENRLTIGAFTHSRIKLLNLITNQAAISLKNAILYNNLVEAKEDLENYNQSLEQKVTQRTQEINDKNQRLKKALKELQTTQAQLIQTEKMSSLGQMVAGIAHEINNPVNFIHGNISHATQYVEDLLDFISIYQQELTESNSIIAEKSEEIDLDFILQDLPKILSSIEVGTSRIRNIVLGLRNFSRLDEAEMKSVDIHEGIENTLMILQHRLKAKDYLSEIQIIKEYAKLPLITCYPGQLNQVFMNILSNAIDALHELQVKDKKVKNCIIRIATELVDSNAVRISIVDNGSGIEQKLKNKIFDPFFTTKPVGSGTGLGLSISYQIIVDKHKGHLICNSTMGEGTEFVIEIPTT